MNKKRVVLGVILAVFLVLVLLFARKLYLVDKIMKNVAKNNEITNYEIFWSDDYTENNFTTNGKTFGYMHAYKYGNNKCYEYMADDGRHKDYTFFYDEKIYHEDSGAPYIVKNQLTNDIYEEMTFKDKLVAVFTWKISSEKLNGKKCYYVRKDINKVEPNHEYEFWLDTETYLKVKATTKEDITLGEPEKNVYYYSIKLNEVTDVYFPNISEYKRDDNLSSSTAE